MQQFILEEQLEVICDEEGIAWEEVQELARDDYFSYATDSSSKFQS